MVRKKKVFLSVEGTGQQSVCVKYENFVFVMTNWIRQNNATHYSDFANRVGGKCVVTNDAFIPAGKFSSEVCHHVC